MNRCTKPCSPENRMPAKQSLISVLCFFLEPVKDKTKDKKNAQHTNQLQSGCYEYMKYNLLKHNTSIPKRIPRKKTCGVPIHILTAPICGIPFEPAVCACVAAACSDASAYTDRPRRGDLRAMNDANQHHTPCHSCNAIT